MLKIDSEQLIENLEAMEAPEFNCMATPEGAYRRALEDVLSMIEEMEE